MMAKTSQSTKYHDRGDLLLAGSIVAVVAVFLLLFQNDSYVLQLASTAALTGSLVLALNVVVGWAHLHSFAQAALYGIGAYTSAILTTKLELPFPVAFVAAILMSAVIGFLVAAPSVRISGGYFAIATIGLQMIVISVINKGGELTGGPAGLVGIPQIELFGRVIDNGPPFFLLVALWLLVVVLIMVNLKKSKFGWELRMIGRDEAVASSVGIHVSSRKIAAFLICAAIAGGTGSLYVHSVGVADPRTFGLPVSATLIVMVLLGGRGSIPAVLLSGVILSFLPEYLRFLSDYRLIVFGFIMMAIVLFLPDGLTGLKDTLVERLRRGGKSDAADPNREKELVEP